MKYSNTLEQILLFSSILYRSTFGQSEVVFILFTEKLQPNFDIPLISSLDTLHNHSAPQMNLINNQINKYTALYTSQPRRRYPAWTNRVCNQGKVIKLRTVQVTK